MDSDMDHTSPTPQYTFDVNQSPFFSKDASNFINVVGFDQLNTLDDVSVLDIFMSANNVIEPHYHQNSAELLFCVSGAVTISMINPSTKELLHFPITPGKVANVPQGWWHYMVATADHTHFLGVFNQSTPEVIFGSDVLTLTPTNIMAHSYCLNENEWKQAISPIKQGTVIGPPVDCEKQNQHNTYEVPNYNNQNDEQMHPYTFRNALTYENQNDFYHY